MPVGNTRPTRVLRGDRQHVRPIERGDPGLAILLGDRDAEQAVPRGDVEHPQGLPAISPDQAREQLGGHLHERGHRAGELDPDRVVVGDRPLVGDRRAAPPHGRREL